MSKVIFVFTTGLSCRGSLEIVKGRMKTANSLLAESEVKVEEIFRWQTQSWINQMPSMWLDASVFMHLSFYYVYFKWNSYSCWSHIFLVAYRLQTRRLIHWHILYLFLRTWRNSFRINFLLRMQHKQRIIHLSI